MGVPGSLVGGESPMPSLLRSALRVSSLSAAWTLAASIAAIIIGLTDGSLALVAFGAVQMFDFAADVVLIVHFRAGAAAEHLERVVLRVVAAGLIAVGAVTVVVSVVHIRSHDEASYSATSTVLAMASFVALTALAVRKRYLADRLPSAALRADGNLSAVGAGLAGVAVGGIAAAGLFEWWWADPVAALVIAIGAIGLGVRSKP
jgi:divalent metal cation (Fe/Co/Zn/Cd) transporter